MIMQIVQDGPVVHNGPKFVLYHIGHDTWFGMGIYPKKKPSYLFPMTDA